MEREDRQRQTVVGHHTEPMSEVTIGSSEISVMRRHWRGGALAVGYYKSVKGREKQDKRLEGDGAGSW